MSFGVTAFIEDGLMLITGSALRFINAYWSRLGH
jgi:hypothetical protein